MMPIPLTVFRVYPEKKALYFTVKVWRTLKDLRAANPGNSRALGLCMPWRRLHPSKDRVLPEMGEVHFCKPHLGVGIVSHEFTHAAIGWAARKRISPEFKDVDVGRFQVIPNDDDEEKFCRALGWMVAQCVDQLYRKKVLK